MVTGKTGLAGFSKAVAQEAAEFGITVNCVAPGLIAIERAKDNPARSIEQRLMPLGRRGKVEEVSALIRYLCGPQARYVTGQSWHVIGGVWLG